jgi:hypothetical protein
MLVLFLKEPPILEVGVIMGIILEKPNCFIKLQIWKITETEVGVEVGVTVGVEVETVIKKVAVKMIEDGLDMAEKNAVVSIERVERPDAKENKKIETAICL